MNKYVLKGNPPVEIALRRSARARRLSLRVSQLDGRVTLTMPSIMPATEALRFADEKATWVREKLADQPGELRPVFGEKMLYRGEYLDIVAGGGRVARIEGHQIRVPGNHDDVARRIGAFLKAQAKVNLHRASENYADRLGKTYNRITLRDTRSRWGSCSSTGNLNYSWRLIMAPPEVLNYVAAHEVAHLAQMNHSQTYWNTVQAIHGPYDAPRLWLRQNGHLLHRYRFQD
ncbi:M48 family metallopeptidase [Pseudaestuariivita rosea]|uniref:M48 family metallopeptidase n=1 Tax=Pseudaestuariivita rosea TaxID=2763263 RepID=UPI001ABB8394|nr:SprT family zinc-dependent metalloprotease [Pseudaestuariivita rosea]